jgi:hypothetical protein
VPVIEQEMRLRAGNEIDTRIKLRNAAMLTFSVGCRIDSTSSVSVDCRSKL